LLVLVGHLSGTRGFVPFDPGVGDYAHLGVVVFFVISGFLITTLLLNEYAEYGRISLRLFYARRSIRIFPASYCYLGLIFLLWRFGGISLRGRDFWYSVCYIINYLPNPSWYVGHLWSLSVEEQFYLLWPLTIVILGPRRAVSIAALFILLGPAARSAAWLFLRHSPYRDLNMFPMVADSLATGCILARLKGWLECEQWYLKLLKPGPSILLVILVLVINRYNGYTIVTVAGETVANIAIGVLIHRSVYYYADWMGRVLNWKPVVFVGVLSYSLYIWQQPFLNRNSASWMTAFPQNLLFAFAGALGSYFLLERPLLRLRHRLHAHATN
jgi:peptidoglycan/LPS O-acetylase OafA/YrhL